MRTGSEGEIIESRARDGVPLSACFFGSKAFSSDSRQHLRILLHCQAMFAVLVLLLSLGASAQAQDYDYPTAGINNETLTTTEISYTDSTGASLRVRSSFRLERYHTYLLL